MAYFQIFLYLQVLDFLTTMVGFHFGAAEASPAIRWMTHFGPAVGVAASKLIAVAIGGISLWLNKRHLIRLVNFWYAGLVVWNLFVLLSITPGAHS
jgi:hypothetical protein